jgi:adenylate kinase family enzyme
MVMNRISIVGTTGSGKTTLSRQLARILDIPCIELDAVHWLPDWTPIERDLMIDRVRDAIGQERWVVEGNYSFVRPAIWERADTVVWLDYSLPTIFGRLARRTLRRIVFQERLWGGNRESLRRSFSRDSILLWCLRSYRRKRAQYPELLGRSENSHLRVLRFRSPRQAERWLRDLKGPPGNASTDIAR